MRTRAAMIGGVAIEMTAAAEVRAATTEAQAVPTTTEAKAVPAAVNPQPEAISHLAVTRPLEPQAIKRTASNVGQALHQRKETTNEQYDQ